MLLIAGASARAAVHSARRGAINLVAAADMFGDQDLRSHVPQWRRLLPSYENLAETLDAFLADGRSAPVSWMYTGALENFVEQIARVRLPLWGNPPTVLTQLRDPFCWTRWLREAGLPVADVRAAADEVAWRRVGWIRKPLRSGGGAKIESWQPPTCDINSQESAWQTSHATSFWQARQVGDSVAGLFVAAHGKAVLLGVTRQLIGTAFGGAEPFTYVGSIGTLPLANWQANAWQQIGNTFAERVPMCGVFGVDAIDTGAEIVPVEINPRYPASAEVIERVSEINVLRCHVDACRLGVLPSDRVWPDAERWAGKMYVFALQPGVATNELDDWFHEQQQAAPSQWPSVADLPAVGTPFSPGSPIATVFVSSAQTAEQCVAALTEKAEAIRTRCRV